MNEFFRVPLSMGPAPGRKHETGKEDVEMGGMIQRRQVERPGWRQLPKHSKESTATMAKLGRAAISRADARMIPTVLLMIDFCGKTAPSQSGRPESGALTG